VAEVVTGWRLLPQHQSPDAAVFQRLVYPEVGVFQGQGRPFTLGNVSGRPVKVYPSAYELAALLGSGAARTRLERGGEQDYAGYPQAWARAQAELGPAPSRDPDLAGLQLALLRHRLTGPEADMESALAYWTYQRHTGVLYTKPSTTPMGKDLSLDLRETAWLEPAVARYRALARLVAAHRRHTPDPAWDRLAEVLGRCIAIAERERRAAPLSPMDIAFLNDLDHTLLALTQGADLPVVVDVHAAPTAGWVVEEATAWPRLVEHGQGQARARGALLSHCEFKQPLAARLTDQQWRERLAATQGRCPPWP
jgi:hypothetical protein